MFDRQRFFIAPAFIAFLFVSVGVISGQTRPLLGEPSPREIDFALRIIF